MMDLKSRAELAERIKELALQMAEVAGELDTAALLAYGCYESLNTVKLETKEISDGN